MVALELFILSSIYSAGGVAAYLYKSADLRNAIRRATELPTKKDDAIEKLVEFTVEERQQDAPMYINTGGPASGLIMPIGGGSRIVIRPILTAMIATDRAKSKFNWRITDFDAQPCAVPKRFWLNTPDDLKTYFEANAIPQNISALRIPLQVREITLLSHSSGAALYAASEYAVAGTNLNRVVRAAIAPHTIGTRMWAAATLIAVGSGGIVWLNWRDNKRLRAVLLSLAGFVWESLGL